MMIGVFSIIADCVQEPQIDYAWTEVIKMVIMIAVSLAASYFLQPDDEDTVLDDSSTSPSTRGTLLPFILGRAKVGPILGYVGDRITTEEKNKSGGKGSMFGGGDSGSTTIYHEKGMHLLCAGQGMSIQAIYQSGIKLNDSPIYAPDTPSGSEVDLGDEGSFRVYWGEAVQDVDIQLALNTGISSSFPHIFYIVWDRKRLGSQATWPQLEYDIEVTHPYDMDIPTDGEYLKGFFDKQTFSGTPQAIKNVKIKDGIVVAGVDLTGYTTVVDSVDTTLFIFRTTDSVVEDFVVGTTVSIGDDSDDNIYVDDDDYYSGGIVNVLYSETAEDYLVMLDTTYDKSYVGNTYTCNYLGGEYSGVNPASALYQILFMEYPHGLGWDTSLFNMSDITTLATLFKDTEVSPCTISLRSGKSYTDAIAFIMQDFGLLFWLDTTSGLWRITAIRAGDSVTTLPSSAYINNELAREYAYATLSADTIVYSFSDVARKFSTSTIVSSDDASAKYSENPNTTKTALTTITDLTTASMVASRRDQEQSLDEVLTVSLNHTYTDACIGGLFELEDFSGQFRLLDKEIDPDSASVKASFAFDDYSVVNNYELIVGSNTNPVNQIDPVEDLYIGVIETNRFLNKDMNGFHIARIRANESIITSTLKASADDLTYNFLDTAYYTTGGTLQEALGVTATLVEEGIFIDETGPDITDVRDLIESEDLWRSGSQIALIGTEICFLQGIDVDTGELVGLIRARFGTRMQEHEEGTPVFIFNGDTISLLQTSFLMPNADLYIKSLPSTFNGQVSESEVTAESITYGGGGYRPLPCENLTTSEGSNAWVAGEDIELEWSYKNATDTGAAGWGLSGEASTLPDPEGMFLVQILSGTTVVRSIEQAGTSYTYTNADLVSDFGSEPTTFDVRVYEVLNGLTSEEETVTINRV